MSRDPWDDSLHWWDALTRYPGATGDRRGSPTPARYGWVYPLFYIPGLVLLVLWLGGR